MKSTRHLDSLRKRLTLIENKGADPSLIDGALAYFTTSKQPESLQRVLDFFWDCELFTKVRQLKIGEGATCPVCPEIVRNLVLPSNTNTAEVMLNPELCYLVLKGTWRVQKATRNDSVADREADHVPGKDPQWIWDTKGSDKTIGQQIPSPKEGTQYRAICQESGGILLTIDALKLRQLVNYAKKKDQEQRIQFLRDTRVFKSMS